MPEKTERRTNECFAPRKAILERDQRERYRKAAAIIREAVLDQVGEREKETAVFFPFSLNSDDDGLIKHILFENFRQKGIDICFATPEGASIYMDRMTDENLKDLKEGKA